MKVKNSSGSKAHTARPGEPGKTHEVIVLGKQARVACVCRRTRQIRVKNRTGNTAVESTLLAMDGLTTIGRKVPISHGLNYTAINNREVDANIPNVGKLGLRHIHFEG